MLPSNTVLTCSCSPTFRKISASVLPLKAKQDVRPGTRSPGTFASALISSSVIPSLKYSSCLSALMLTNGSTATDFEDSNAAAASPFCGGIFSPALRTPSTRCSARSSSNHFPISSRALTPKSGQRTSSSRRALLAALLGIECDGPLCGTPEGFELFEKEQGRGQGEIGEMIGRRRVGRSSRGLQCAGERIGSGVESVLIFFSVNDRQHGPAIRIIWQLLNSSLQADPGGGMLVGGEALVIAEAAQDRLVGA